MVERWTAYKLCIHEILTATLTHNDPQGFTDSKQHLVNRVNIIATVVERIDTPSMVMLILDDATDKIAVRCFEPEKVTAIKVGDCILIIGRIREFNQERYLIAEIIKPVTTPWAQIRKQETHRAPQHSETRATLVDEDLDTAYTTILEAVNELDHGHGADHKEILQKVGNPSTEKTINRLLELGEIYEIKPGKLKVMK